MEQPIANYSYDTNQQSDDRLKVAMSAVFSIFDLFQIIIPHLKLAELMAFSRCTKFTRSIVPDRRIMTIFRKIVAAKLKSSVFLGMCFDTDEKVRDFLHSLRTHHGILSGSFIVECLLSVIGSTEPFSFRGSDIDIFALEIPSEAIPNPFRHKCGTESETRKLRYLATTKNNNKLNGGGYSLQQWLEGVPNSMAVVDKLCTACADGQVVCVGCLSHLQNSFPFEQVLCKIAMTSVDPKNRNWYKFDGHNPYRFSAVDPCESLSEHILHLPQRSLEEFVPNEILIQKKDLIDTTKQEIEHIAWLPVHENMMESYDYDNLPWEFAIVPGGPHARSKALKDKTKLLQEKKQGHFPYLDNQTRFGTAMLRRISYIRVLERAYDIWTPVDILKTRSWAETLNSLRTKEPTSCKGDPSVVSCHCIDCSPASSLISPSPVDFDLVESLFVTATSNPENSNCIAPRICDYMVFRPEQFVCSYLWPSDGFDPYSEQRRNRGLYGDDEDDVKKGIPPRGIAFSKQGRFNIVVVKPKFDEKSWKLQTPQEALRSHVASFDIDIIQNGYDGKTLFVRSIGAIVSMKATLNLERLGNRFDRERIARRVAKYRQRGFLVTSPPAELIKYLSASDEIDTKIPTHYLSPVSEKSKRRADVAEETITKRHKS